MTTSTPADLESTVRRYFDLMYDCDVQHFDEVFVDHLSLLRTGGSWRITAKTFHLERVAS